MDAIFYRGKEQGEVTDVPCPILRHEMKPMKCRIWVMVGVYDHYVDFGLVALQNMNPGVYSVDLTQRTTVIGSVSGGTQVVESMTRVQVNTVLLFEWLEERGVFEELSGDADFARRLRFA